MSESTYKTRKSFLIPLGLDTALLFVLLMISLCTGNFPVETIILVIIFIPIFYLFMESSIRQVSVEAHGIKIKKLFRGKKLEWKDITNVDSMVVRKKVYLLLTTTKGFHVLTNTYEEFTSLVKAITDHIDEAKVETRVRDMVDTPVRRVSDILMAWVAVVIIAAVILIKYILEF
jgi:hypothetical protein